MRPKELKTKIFLDSGDPKETHQALLKLGFLDGQTTNPTLIAKNPVARKRLEDGKKFTRDEIYTFYRAVVGEISSMIPLGSVSVEVYADRTTRSEEMLKQSREMFRWIPNAHVKLPITAEGLTVAQQATSEGIRVNMTLCFSQEQAAAVYAATRGAQKGDVFVSPFVGRFDDIGLNGMDLIRNICQMYKPGDGHVEVLSASVRSMDHFLYALRLGSDIITAPLKVLFEWADKGMPIPDGSFLYGRTDLREMPYYDIGLGKQWGEYDITHDLTEKGIDRFCQDWNALIA